MVFDFKTHFSLGMKEIRAPYRHVLGKRALQKKIPMF